MEAKEFDFSLEAMKDLKGFLTRRMGRDQTLE